MTTTTQTPPMSRRSSSTASSPTGFGAKRGLHSPNLSLDLSDLPSLYQPSPPSNTLIITNLNDPLTFTPQNLDNIRLALESESPLYSFAPLKSFRRIIVTFYTTESSIAVRQKLDGETVLGQRIRVYFGQETKITAEDEIHLKAPKSSKLFFISPPPSPPHGWEVRDEEPPNKEVHADDLAAALHKLSAKTPAAFSAAQEQDVGAEKVEHANMLMPNSGSRQRSDSRTIVFSPADQGHSPDLPAIAVEDTSCGNSPTQSNFDGEGNEVKPMLHTARPPVELIE